MNLFSKFWCMNIIFKSDFVAKLDQSNSTFTFPLEDFGSGKY